MEDIFERTLTYFDGDIFRVFLIMKVVIVKVVNDK